MTDKQKLFVEEYLIDLNATRAYKVVYKSCKKDNTAWTNGNALLRNTEVKKLLEKRMKERTKRTEITQDSTIRGINNIAKANITDVVELVKTADNTFIVQVKDFATLPEDIKYAIASIKQLKDGTIEVKMHDKVKALEMQARHQGLFIERVQVDGNLTASVNKLDSIMKQLGE